MKKIIDGISVVIMAFNEEHNLASVVLEVTSVLEQLPGAHEVLIIDDGSTDHTSAIAERLAQEFPVIRVVRHSENRGLGAVYRTAFDQVSGAFVTFFPADGQAPAQILAQFRPLMDQADMVLGYLTHSGATSLWAHGLAAAERMAYRLLFRSMPRFKGIFMFRRSLLEAIDLKSTGQRDWVICMELILRASQEGYRLVSVPTELRHRSSGRSKVNSLPVIWANFRQIIKLRWRLRRA